jgi:hypothetical protein
MDEDLAGTPVDVIKADPADLAGAQTQPGQHSKIA